MINEITRLIDRWQKHPQYGVNAVLATLPHQTPEGAEEPLPGPLTVYNDTENDEVAKELDPPSVPAVIVWVDSATDISLRGYKRAKAVMVAVAFVTRDTDDLTATRDCGYVLQAIVESLDHYNSQDKARGMRELNKVRILEVAEVTTQRVTATVGRSQMWGFAMASVHAVTLP